LLPSVFRLSKTTREAVIKGMEDLDKLDDIGDSDDDNEAAELLIEAIGDIVKLIAAKGGERLLKAIADSSDDAVVRASLLGDVLAKWMENTQAGEA
jgi:hypothetical protein